MLFRPGAIAGLIIGVVVCGIIAFVAIKLSKKENASIDAILATLPEELKDTLRNQTFTETQGKDMFTSNALVTSVTEDGDKVKATLMFYMEEHDGYYTRNVKLTESEADSKGIKANRFVPVILKYDREMHYYDFKKLA
ncbi:MAG: hypothetical protein K6A80_02970 [Saccharofermentans sp.]|nr:hypothetical protein [Saccharofermentans sp.]